ncbi:hypothetical protein D3C87_1919890 [compost metagenome]
MLGSLDAQSIADSVLSHLRDQADMESGDGQQDASDAPLEMETSYAEPPEQTAPVPTSHAATAQSAAATQMEWLTEDLFA